MELDSSLFDFADDESTIRGQMHDRILALAFPAYCQLIRRLLYNSGYSSIQSLGTGAKRKTTGRGGSDLLALAHTDLATALTAIQIKQYRQSVPRRFIDELRGTMLRLGAEQGLLIVTSRFSSTAKNVAAQPQVLPIQLVDGQQLIDLLIARRIGMKQVRIVEKHTWILDSDYFDAIEAQAQHQLNTAKGRRGAPNPIFPEDCPNPEGRGQ